MRPVFSSCRARFAASSAALLGIVTMSGCQNTPPAETGAYAPDPVAAQPIIEEPVVTTLAIGEEDGTGFFPVEPGGGIGDGAGPIPFDPNAPQPIGGVQGDFERIYIPPDPDNVGQPVNDGFATTLAIGEEG